MVLVAEVMSNARFLISQRPANFLQLQVFLVFFFPKISSISVFKAFFFLQKPHGLYSEVIGEQNLPGGLLFLTIA